MTESMPSSIQPNHAAQKPNPNSDPELRTLHLLSTRSDNRTGPRYVIASVQLFSFLNAPTYDVVVGEYQGP
jgi:hypothetical protein